MNNNRLVVSYILWLACFMGFGGLHRLYNGKIGTGLLWFFTWGLCGIGQFIDLFLIPSVVEEHDLRLQARSGRLPQPLPIPRATPTPRAVPPTKDQLTLNLLKAAQKRGGKISVTQAVLDTGASFPEVEKILQEMVKGGYADPENDPSSGIVIYNFLEL
ncbi:NINE protein [Lusitaniella coriacea LEGE 07157]|uniref:NINE protein n=1 Tax=Lusitaniella coriacea LEGE 07157 TaxID=945747 RepID=A0A8J7DU42_9CYAN|nr:TM2 domain-containing protein [Lusitaniella coriacea]MBE9114981.1 NINE protein [Lusitaniella coriacea LEGE 07157]